MRSDDLKHLENSGVNKTEVGIVIKIPLYCIDTVSAVCQIYLQQL